MIRPFAIVLSCLLALSVAGCASKAPEPDTQSVTRLAAEIQALGPEVDPEEAERAARIAYAYTDQLAREYQITDPPLVHNTKVNMGLRPRGLCWHWAEDIEARLKQEQFRTLQMHRAIANSDVAFRIDHSTAIISRRGDSMFDGIVLDPWRYGGRLFWSPTRTDTRYPWRPRTEVLNEKRRRAQSRAAAAP